MPPAVLNASTIVIAITDPAHMKGRARSISAVWAALEVIEVLFGFFVPAALLLAYRHSNVVQPNPIRFAFTNSTRARRNDCPAQTCL
jgi:hypothetical protein